MSKAFAKVQVKAGESKTLVVIKLIDDKSFEIFAFKG